MSRTSPAAPVSPAAPTALASAVAGAPALAAPVAPAPAAPGEAAPAAPRAPAAAAPPGAAVAAVSAPRSVPERTASGRAAKVRGNGRGGTPGAVPSACSRSSSVRAGGAPAGAGGLACATRAFGGTADREDGPQHDPL